MSPNKCRVCGVAEWRHVCAGSPVCGVEVKPVGVSKAFEGRVRSASKGASNMANRKPAEKDMANSMANKIEHCAGSTYRYRDAEARRVYQRELMRKKRAGVSA